MSRVAELRCATAVECDHGTPILADAYSTGCYHCEIAFQLTRIAPKVTYWNRNNEPILGICDECDDEVMISGHLYKRPDGSYVCERCIDGNRGECI